ncbi:hypothetical protein MMRN_54240 [Mycobacterium marinum]|nr:hypothetical protein MMRN_54240 [Mycobacterium marinum]
MRVLAVWVVLAAMRGCCPSLTVGPVVSVVRAPMRVGPAVLVVRPGCWAPVVLAVMVVRAARMARRLARSAWAGPVEMVAVAGGCWGSVAVVGSAGLGRVPRVGSAGTAVMPVCSVLVA